MFDHSQSDWLRQSIWDPLKEDIFLVHGYAGGDDTLPINVLRDGLQHNFYNFNFLQITIFTLKLILGMVHTIHGYWIGVLWAKHHVTEQQ